MSTLRSRGASCQPSSSLVDSSGCSEPAAGQPGLPLSVTGSSPLRLQTCSIRPAGPARRRKRMMTPVDKKDSTYWGKRLKNNEAARRSREKRRLSDLMREGQLLALSEENTQLRACVLSLQYHTSVNAGSSKSASPAGATLTSSVVAPTLSLSPRYPAYFQAGHWVNSGDATASILSVRHQENRSCETSCFGTIEADGVFKGTHSFATSSLEGQRPAEAEKGPHRHFFYSDDSLTNNYYIRALLHNASTHIPHSCLEPHLSSSAVCNNLLLPWQPSYVPPPTIVYPGLPHYIQERQSQSWFSFAGPGWHLSPNGH